MGWRPWEVYACTIDEFLEAWGGWCDVHCAPPAAPPPPDDNDIAALLDYDAALQERRAEARDLTEHADAG